jgi:hypothetical protein
LAIAARLSGTRLIDNIRLDEVSVERAEGLEEAAHGK